MGETAGEFMGQSLDCGHLDVLQRLDIEALRERGDLLRFDIADDVDQHDLMAAADHGDDEPFDRLLAPHLGENLHVIALGLLPDSDQLAPAL